MYKVGEEIYCIEVDDDYDFAEVNKYLYMAKCGEYIICCGQDSNFKNDFNMQLKKMCSESFVNYGVTMQIIKENHVFTTHEDAIKRLQELQERN